MSRNPGSVPDVPPSPLSSILSGSRSTIVPLTCPFDLLPSLYVLLVPSVSQRPLPVPSPSFPTVFTVSGPGFSTQHTTPRPSSVTASRFPCSRPKSLTAARTPVSPPSPPPRLGFAYQSPSFRHMSLGCLPGPLPNPCRWTDAPGPRSRSQRRLPGVPGNRRVSQVPRFVVVGLGATLPSPAHVSKGASAQAEGGAGARVGPGWSEGGELVPVAAETSAPFLDLGLGLGSFLGGMMRS